MKVLSRSGSHAFLIEVEEGRGVVLDITGGEPTVSQMMSVEALASGGYWEAFEGEDVRIVELTRRVLAEGEELPAIGFDVQAGARRLLGVPVMPEDLRGVSVALHGIARDAVVRQDGATFVFILGSAHEREAETAGAS